MTSRFTELIVDCHDPRKLAGFWMAVLGYRILEEREDLVEISAWEPTVDAVRERANAPTLTFIRVPEGKTVKNRFHIDVSPIDASRRVGARVVVRLPACRAGDEAADLIVDRTSSSVGS